MPYDSEALIERGEFVPVSMVAGRELGERAEDLSEQQGNFNKNFGE